MKDHLNVVKNVARGRRKQMNIYLKVSSKETRKKVKAKCVT